MLWFNLKLRFRVWPTIVTIPKLS